MMRLGAIIMFALAPLAFYLSHNGWITAGLAFLPIILAQGMINAIYEASTVELFSNRSSLQRCCLLSQSCLLFVWWLNTDGA